MSFEFTQKMSNDVFRETKSYIVLIFPVLFSLRLLYLNMTAANSREYGELVKGAALFLALLLSYEYLLSLTFDFSRALEGDIAQQTTQRLLLSQKDPIATPGLSLVRKTLGLITSVVYYLSQCLFIISLIFMSALAPIVFLFGTVLSMPSLIKIFYFLILIGSSWPLLFSVFDRVGGSLLQNGLKSESQIFYWSIDLLIELFKLLSPLSFCKLLLQSTFGGSALSALSGGKEVGRRVAGGFVHGFTPPRYLPQQSKRRGQPQINSSFGLGNRSLTLPPFASSRGSSFQKSSRNYQAPITHGISGKSGMRNYSGMRNSKNTDLMTHNSQDSKKDSGALPLNLSNQVGLTGPFRNPSRASIGQNLFTQDGSSQNNYGSSNRDTLGRALSSQGLKKSNPHTSANRNGNGNGNGNGNSSTPSGIARERSQGLRRGSYSSFQKTQLRQNETWIDGSKGGREQ
ncbi:MAG: hypothetical protein IPJ71_19470 [Bdellovibrionales bacterium]|nr:hypothetical protein [Bdellovibrionales bacterium]